MRSRQGWREPFDHILLFAPGQTPLNGPGVIARGSRRALDLADPSARVMFLERRQRQVRILVGPPLKPGLIPDVGIPSQVAVDVVQEFVDQYHKPHRSQS